MIKLSSKYLRHGIIAVAFCISIAIYSTISQNESQSHEFFDVRPSGEHIAYLYCPGLMATEMVMGRYCPSFTAITGEKFTFKKGGHVIGQPHIAVIFPEIDLRKPNYFTWNPITAYINRIRSDFFPLFARMFREKYDFEVEDNPDSKTSVINYTFNFGKANAGQKLDMQAIHSTYHEYLKQNPDAMFIAYGDSRGSTALFNFLAEYKPTRIKAAVLESIEDDINHQFKHLFYIDKGQAIEARLMSFHNFIVRSYKENGPCPRKYAEIITDEVPLLLVGSLKDGIVDPQCLIYLYNRLRAGTY